MTLADFTYETPDEVYTAYPTQGQPGLYWITPQRLGLALRPDGTADLQLSLVRATFPTPRTYGVLDLAMQAEYAFAAATQQLRTGDAPITVRPLLPNAGYLRLALGTTVLTQPLAWNGLSQTRLRLHLTPDAASVLRQALEKGTMVVQATAGLTLTGNAACAAARVTFDPHALLKALAPGRDETGYFPYTTLQRFFAEAWEQLPLQWQGSETGESVQPETLRAALLDRVVTRFGVLVNSPTDAPLAYIDLPDPMNSGEITWQLADPFTAWRPLVLQWHPLEVVREQIATHGLAPFFTLTTVPPLPTGAFAIEVVANLPAQRVNILSIGAYLTAPPHPPFRPQPAQATAAVLPPSDVATVTLRLSAKEPLVYEVRPFVVLATADGFAGDFITLEGVARSAESTSINLSVADYPVDFYPITAEPSLLALARLTGEVRWQDGERQHRVLITLDEDHPLATIAIPQNMLAPTLHLTAEALADERSLILPPVAAEDAYLTLWHLPGFGAHTIRFTTAATANTADQTLEVQAETATETTRLTLRADHPTQGWGYVALNPFHAGFRYRLLPDGLWSPFLSPLDYPEVML